ncbi:hypothetical protein [uncultured Corynebacterium sp.]|uniref:hypothetical protein n=1 Tax=uncultured Corynebacterium sp. TaxID=159447 RepID=UPI0028EDF953|nr:hypothetical protein [uncultured Corynebacterium sp.]
MSRKRTFMAAILAPILGAALCVTPTVYAKESRMDAQFKCDITTKGLSSFMAKQADGPQSNDKFKFNFTVDAPEQVTVGEEFDYTIKGGFVGLPKSFPVAGVATVNIKTVEQARLFVDLPDNIEVTNIAAAGGQRGVKVEKLAGKNRLRVGGNFDSDRMNSRDPNTIKLATGDKGMVGVEKDGKVGFDLPTITVTARATKAGVIQPAFPKVSSPDTHHYPADQSLLSLVAQAKANARLFGSYDVTALTRCTVDKSNGFPKVRAVEVPKPQPALVTITSTPEVGQVGQASTFTFVVEGTDGKPLANTQVKTTIGDETETLTTDGNGVATRSFTPTAPGAVQVTAVAGDQDEVRTYQVNPKPTESETTTTEPTTSESEPTTEPTTTEPTTTEPTTSESEPTTEPTTTTKSTEPTESTETTTETTEPSTPQEPGDPQQPSYKGKSLWQILSGIFAVGIVGILAWFGLANLGIVPAHQ